MVDVSFGPTGGREAVMASPAAAIGSTVEAMLRRKIRGATGAKREAANLRDAMVMVWEGMVMCRRGENRDGDEVQL